MTEIEKLANELKRVSMEDIPGDPYILMARPVHTQGKLDFEKVHAVVMKHLDKDGRIWASDLSETICREFSAGERPVDANKTMGDGRQN